MATFLERLRAGRDSVVNGISTQAKRFDRKFLEAAAAGVALVVAADGKVEDDEIDTAVEFFSTSKLLTAWTTKEKVDLFNSIMPTAMEKLRQAELLGTIAALKGTPNATTLAEVIVVLANSDGDFADAEKKMVKRICRALGLVGEDYID